MAKITVTLCDVCEHDGVERTGLRHSVVLDGKAYEIDLCDEHDGAVLAPLFAVLTGRGRKARGGKGPRLVRTTPTVQPAPATLAIKCTEPGCTRTFDTEQRRNRHIGQGHKRSRVSVAFSA